MGDCQRPVETTGSARCSPSRGARRRRHRQRRCAASRSRSSPPRPTPPSGRSARRTRTACPPAVVRPATHARRATAARGDVETRLARVCGIFTGAEPVVLSSTGCSSVLFTGAAPVCPKFHHHHYYHYPHNCYYHFQLGFRASAPLHLHRLPLVMLVQLGCARGNRGPRALARRGRSNAGAMGARADAKGARRPVAPSEDAPHVGLRRQVRGRPKGRCTWMQACDQCC